MGEVLNSGLQDFYTTHRVQYQTQKSVERPAAEFSQSMRLAQLEQVWDATSKLRTLGSLAAIHRGIEYRHSLGKGGASFVSATARPDSVPGLHKVDDNVEPFIVTKTNYLNVTEEFMRGTAYQHDWSAPKLIVNANPQSRGKWRITASIDRSGLVCYQNFHAIWPTSNLSLEVLAAILNGPVANAFISTRDPIRHVLIRTLKKIPIPEFSAEREESLASLVRRYVDTRNRWIDHLLEDHQARSECQRLISAIDSEVLNAYGLPRSQETTLLNWFTGSQRLGPIEFTGQLPHLFSEYSCSDGPIDEIPNPMPVSTAPSGKARLFNKLQVDFVAAPVEDGMEHEAEQTLGSALHGLASPEVFDWIREFCTDVARPTFASSVLRCLATLDYPGTTEWRSNVIQDALHTDNVDIRDAAVQAVEHWGETGLLRILASHHENAPWLKAYVEGVISDLRG